MNIVSIRGGLRVLLANVLLAAAVATVSAARADDEAAPACRDNYDRIMANAQAEWPNVSPYSMAPEVVAFFVLGYNNQEDREHDLIADTIVIFPVATDYVFVFAFLSGCMTRYVDLTPQKAYHLVELGHSVSREY